MAKFTTIKNNFASGELSKKLRARIDSKEYANGVEEMINFFPMVNGGAMFRPGMQYTRDRTESSKFNSNTGVLFGFRFSRDECYVVHIHCHGEHCTDTAPATIYNLNGWASSTVTWVS